MGLGLTSIITSTNALKSNLSTTLPEIAQQTAGILEAQVGGEIKALEAVAARSEIADPNNLWENQVKLDSGGV